MTAPRGIPTLQRALAAGPHGSHHGCAATLRATTPPRPAVSSGLVVAFGLRYLPLVIEPHYVCWDFYYDPWCTVLRRPPLRARTSIRNGIWLRSPSLPAYLGGARTPRKLHPCAVTDGLP